MGKYHINTGAEVQHKLEGTVYYSEVHIGHRIHQVPVSTDTSKNSAVFQSQEGLHRMKRL